MAAAGPGAAVLRPEGHEQQHRQLAQPLDREVEQLLRARVDPVHVLEEGEDGPPPRKAGELVQQDLERPRLAPLRARVRGRVALAGGQAQQLGDERHGGRRVGGRLAEESLQPVEVGRGRVVAADAGRALELLRHRPERAARVVRRALVGERGMRLVGEPLAQRPHEPRLANAGLAR